MENVRNRIGEIRKEFESRVFEWATVRSEVEDYILSNYGGLKVHGAISVEKIEIDNDRETDHNLYRVKDERGLLFEFQIYSTWDEFELVSLQIRNPY